MLADDEKREESISSLPEPTPALKFPFWFGARMLGLIFLLKIAIGLVILLPIYSLAPVKGIFADGGITEDVMRGGKLLVFLSFLVLPIETLLGQALPIGILSRMRFRSRPVLCLLSAICFGFLHFGSGVLDVFHGFVAGLVLSHCWISWRPESFGLAFWGTTFVHAAHNGIAMILFGLLASLGPDLSSGPPIGIPTPPFLDRAEIRNALPESKWIAGRSSLGATRLRVSGSIPSFLAK